MSEVILKAVNITKRFGDVVANDSVNFELNRGEIHALLGENGAGKTTLMNILYGIYLPSEGQIYLEEKPVVINSPLDAIRLGIGMIHQHFMLVDTLTVYENIILGLKEYGIIIKKRAILQKLKEIEDRYNLKVNPFEKIWQLAVGEQQKVEIIKVLFRGANILILDEPTAVLTPQETKSLFNILKNMKNNSKSIIFISHKLEEVLQISDRITVMRAGRIIKTLNKKNTSKEQLADLMMADIKLLNIPKENKPSDETILEVNNLQVISDKGVKSVDGLSLKVKRGEILGIAGVSGNGQKELVQTIAGVKKAIGGRIIFNGIDITNKPPRFIAKSGINYIPADRLAMGVAPNLNCVDNAILRCYYRKPFLQNGIMKYKKAIDYTKQIVKDYNVKLKSIFSPIKLLSGGNMQKLILARELLEKPKLLIASYPTRGLDLASTIFFRKKLVEIAKEGTTVILVSEDLDEILSLSDRVVVMYEGKIVGIVNPKTTDKNTLGLMMAGITP